MPVKPSIQFSLRPVINVAVFGCVSVGKSTFLNMMMTRMFSDCHIKRTTTMPQIYYEITEAEVKETDQKEENDARELSDLAFIRTLNSDINTVQMKEQAKSGVSLKLEDIKPSEYIVPPIKGFAKLQRDSHGNGVTLAIHDMPGLNDSISRDVYFEYVKQNFAKYDVAIFILDIHSSINTSDEVAILDLILSGIKKNKSNKIETKLMVIMNKCDELELHEKLEPIPEDVELQEMVQQARDIICVRAKELEVDISDWQLSCLSSEDSFVYRMIEAKRFDELDIKYINRIGQLEFPAREWKRYDESKKRIKVKDFIENEGSEEGLKMSGFVAFKAQFEKLLNKKNQYKLCFNRININLANIQNSDKLDIESELSWYHKIKVVIHNTNRIFKVKLDSNFDEFNSTFGTFLQKHMTFLTKTLPSVDDIEVLNKIKSIQSEWRIKLNMKIYNIIEDIKDSINSQMKSACASQLSNLSLSLKDLESIIKTLVKNEIDSIDEIRSMMQNIYQYKMKYTQSDLRAVVSNFIADDDDEVDVDDDGNEYEVDIDDATKPAFHNICASGKIFKFIMEIPEETGINIDDRHLALAKASIQFLKYASQTEKLCLGRIVKSYKIDSNHPYWYIAQLFSNINLEEISVQALLDETQINSSPKFPFRLVMSKLSLPGLFMNEVFTLYSH
jgi:hypothetical protein